MRNLIIVCGLLFIETFYAGICIAATYDEAEIAKLRKFLLQESAEPGKKNYQQLGMNSMDNIEWSSVRGLSWNSVNYHLERVRWQSSKLSGHLDFSDFEGLNYLVCSFNDIKSVNVTNSAKLQWLDIYTNDLTEVDVTTNPSLDYLRLGYNNISSLDLSNNPYLRFLCCTNNKLETLDMSNKGYLETLYCVGNNFKSLNIENCTRLEEFLCDFNRLEYLNLDNLSSLKSFSCTGNGMNDLRLFNCVSLEEIFCNNNELCNLDFSNCEFLSKIHCNNNNLTSINLKGCVNLTELVCHNNLLHVLDVSDSPLLSSLSCRYNYLSFLTLPLPSDLLTEYAYAYAPQYNVEMECGYNNVDLNAFYMINDSISKYTWFYSYTTLTPKESNEGLFVFDESFIGETPYCLVQNKAFPMLVMRFDVNLLQGDVSNAKPEINKPAVYASERTIHISSGASAAVSIYAMDGMLLMKKKVEAGLTNIPFQRGVYVVVVNDNLRYKLIVR